MGLTALACILLIVLPRKYALIPVIVLTCYLPMGERVLLGGFNFTTLRILTFVGWARILMRGEVKNVSLNKIDWAVISCSVAGMIGHVLLWQTYESFKYKLGHLYDGVGMYFVFRAIICDTDDIMRTIRTVALLILPLAACMVVEKITGRNVFAIFGSVNLFTTIRNGTVRCQGPFAHPILSGTFGATLFPLCVVLWKKEYGHRLLAICGIVSSLVIVMMAGSSGPLVALFAEVIGLSLWPFRFQMSRVRWGIVLTLIFLEIVMKSHVWFLMARIDLVGGSTGYHRAFLIDRALANLEDWWLFGTKSTASWAGEDAHLYDVTNQYIFIGAEGGLLAMLLFILVIARSFSTIGTAIRSKQKELSVRSFLSWALGAALLGHVVSFLSVSYFDQNMVNWRILITFISTLAALILVQQRQNIEGGRMRSTCKLPAS